MSSRTVRTRFAPSPTGLLHVGNARTALMNWLFARRHGGEMTLRMDDTDRERSNREFEKSILEDLEWLGLDWDGFVRQSARMGRYEAAMERLRQAGRLYPCYETPEELDLKRKIQLGQGRPPVYDRGALSLSAEEQAALVHRGRTPHWRFLLRDEPVAWDDMARGPVRFEPGHLSDPVLVREDGRPLYTLTSVVDDGEMAVSHVMRGEDHVANTAVQVQLFEALGFDAPRFVHLPLMTGADGKALSKRIGSLSLRDLRAEGIEPAALAAYLVRLGTPVAPTGEEDLGDLIARFDLSEYGRAAPRYDPSELAALNAKAMHHMPFEAVRPRLEAMGLDGADAAFWTVARENVERLDDVAHWWRVCKAEIEPVVEPEDADFLHEAADLLPPEPWDGETWAAWTGALKQATGRKGKGLFLPLRRALTGRDHGPEIKHLLPLIGRERVLRRLSA